MERPRISSTVMKFALPGNDDKGFMIVQKGRAKDTDQLLLKGIASAAEAPFYRDNFDTIELLEKWINIRENRMLGAIQMIDSDDTKSIQKEYQLGYTDMIEVYYYIKTICDSIFERITDTKYAFSIKYRNSWEHLFGVPEGNYTVISNDELSKLWMDALEHHSRAKYKIALLEKKLEKYEVSEPKNRTRFGDNK